jgi:DNA-binding NarL/FixJ family response regulator
MNDIASGRADDLSEEPRGSVTVLIEPRLLTRQCLSAWLEHREPAIDLRALARPTDALDEAGETVGLVIWSIGTASIVAPPQIVHLKRLRERFPRAFLVILADREDPVEIAEAIRLGASGYVPTSLDRKQAGEVLRFIRAGGAYVPPSVVAGPSGDRRAEAEEERLPTRPFGELTPRERDVVERIRQGKPNKVIAHELEISESTVKVFVHRILNKLGAVNRTEAAYLLHQQGDLAEPAKSPN